MKKTIPLLIVIIGGVIWLAWVFVPHRLIQDVFYGEFYLPWARAMAPFAMLRCYQLVYDALWQN